MEREARVYSYAVALAQRQKICEKSISVALQNHPKTLPKSIPKRSKIELWRRVRWRSLFDPKSGPIFSAPGSPWASSWGRLGASWGAPGPSWGVLGASWGRLWTSWERFGTSWGLLGASCGLSAEKPSKNHRFHHRKSNLEPWKIKPPLQRERGLRDFPISAMNPPFGTIWVPTCLHFGSIFRALGRLEDLLGPLGSVLGASWGRLGGILGRLVASWGALGRLGGVLAPF